MWKPKMLYATDHNVIHDFGCIDLLSFFKEKVESIDPEYKFPGKFEICCSVPEHVYHQCKRWIEEGLEKFPEREDTIGIWELYIKAWNAKITMNYFKNVISMKILSLSTPIYGG